MKGEIIIDRTGEKSINFQGYEMTIVEYFNSKNITIEFNDADKTRISCVYSDFKNGKRKNPNHKSYNGVGYLGVGMYDGYTNNKPNKNYDVWQSMIKRCYDSKYHQRFPTYKNCKVCEEWQNFQNFAEWYDENYYEIKNERMCLDKDILFKGNKIYSPEMCAIVPESLNILLIKNDSKRGKYPIGVTWCKRGEFYISRCNIGKKSSKYLGSFETEQSAFEAYKNFKESFIKGSAEKYKNLIPNIVYDALKNYTVEIND